MAPYRYDAPFVNPFVGSIGELLSRQNDAAARAAEISGQAWGRAIDNAGQIGANAVNAIVQERREAPIRAQQDELRRLQLGEAREAVAAKQQRRQRDQVFMHWIGQGKEPTPREMLSIGFSPDEVAEYGKGLAAFEALETKKTADARADVGRVANSLTVFGPDLQGGMWPQVRAKAKEAGFPGELPAAPSPEAIKGVLAWATGQAPAKTDGFTLSPGQQRFDANGNPVASVPAATPEPKRHPVIVPGPNGRSVRKMFTEEELAKGVEEYREPKEGSTARFWVMRNGQPVRISESEYRLGDQPANTREQGRPVTSGDAGRVADFDTSLDDLNVLERDLGKTGTGSKIGASLPNVVTDLLGWGADSKQRQAVIDRVKQVIGKALEGGVLRKEDEYKYEKILPTIGDEKSVAESKIKGLREAITKRRQTLLDSLADAGYDVTKYQARPPHGGGAVTMRAPDGTTKPVPADQVDHYKRLGATVVEK